MCDLKILRLQKQLMISRDLARTMGSKTVKIIEEGKYYSSSGDEVDLTESIKFSVERTDTYPPGKFPEQSFHQGSSVTRVEVRNETTLSAFQYLASFESTAAVLNLASATSPGGGFLNGARAQEEYLARSSTLYACLKGNPMYAYHRDRLDPFYSDYVIYSPGIPVIRNDDGKLLDEPYLCSMITSPAVHAYGVRRYMRERENEISGAMWKRILKVLAVAQCYGHKSLVLGAWGCGAFGNNGNVIAKLFHEALSKEFRGAFEYIVFAITDWSDEGRFIGPFEECFKNGKVE